jgi:hypothetical protein
MELLPELRRRDTPRETVNEQQLLAYVQAALQQLCLDVREIRIAFEQRLEARGVLLPQGVPQRDRGVGGVAVALARRLRLAGVAARELGVQDRHAIAQDLGDARPLARGQSGGRERPQVAWTSPRRLRRRW